MIYDFFKRYEELLPLEQMSLLDYRLDNVNRKLNKFFQNLVISHIDKEEITIYLAGSCLKHDTFSDLDLFFPSKEDFEILNDAMNKDYFEYSNNSYTYKYNHDIYQLVYREKYKNKSLEELVSGFDFASTKIAFECIYDTKKRLFTIKEVDLREDFTIYLNSKYNPLKQMSINPMVTLQRAIYFTRKGDNVPFDTFLQIIDKIVEMKLDDGKDKADFMKNLQGNPNKLTNIKNAIEVFCDEKR